MTKPTSSPTPQYDTTVETLSEGALEQLAHDLAAPLHSIALCAEKIKAQRPLDTEMEKEAQTIIALCRKGLTVTAVARLLASPQDKRSLTEYGFTHLVRLTQEVIDDAAVLERFRDPLDFELRVNGPSASFARLRVRLNDNLLRHSVDQLLTYVMLSSYAEDTVPVLLSVWEPWVVLSVECTGLPLYLKATPGNPEKRWKGSPENVLNIDSRGVALRIAELAMKRLGGRIELEADGSKTQIILKIPIKGS